MDWFAKGFIKSALVWLGLGVTLGVIMAAAPAGTVYRTAHLHMNLLGFVAMMIYGVSYHVMPRFTGNPLHSVHVAGAQWWLANAGLAVLVVGFGLRAHGAAMHKPAMAIGGTAATAAAYLFIYNIWRTLDGRRLRARASRGTNPPERRLPTAP